MDTIPSEANQAISIAVKALRSGDKNNARRYAWKAVALEPNLEYAWLVLAEVSTLKHRIEYLERAILINPGRMSSHEDLRRTLEKMDNQVNLEPTTSSSSSLTRNISPKNKKFRRIFFIPLFLFISLIIVFSFWGWIGNNKSVLAAILPGISTGVSGVPDTWGGSNILKPTRNPTATVTQTPTQTMTSTLIPSSTLLTPTLQISISSTPSNYSSFRGYIYCSSW